MENSKYGWFWNCPNGNKCIYRHALPPGFVLKKDQKKAEKGEELSLEDLIEREVSLIFFIVDFKEASESSQLQIISLHLHDRK